MKPCDDYEDILLLSRPLSGRHKPMPAAERAAQFAPFAALTGYEDLVRETARLTTERIELDEDAREELDRTLQLLAAQVRSHGRSQLVCVTYFCPDSRKTGGTYQTCSGSVVKLPADHRVMVLETAAPPGREGLSETGSLPDVSDGSFADPPATLHRTAKNSGDGNHLSVPLQDILSMELC